MTKCACFRLIGAGEERHEKEKKPTATGARWRRDLWRREEVNTYRVRVYKRMSELGGGPKHAGLRRLTLILLLLLWCSNSTVVNIIG